MLHRTSNTIPIDHTPDNDVRKKKERNHLKRNKNKQRKQLNKDKLDVK
jgi:hypothetical protein